MVDIKRLRRFSFLASLNDGQLTAWLPRFGEEQRPRNELVFREGEAGSRFYLVEAGQIAAYKRVDQAGDQFLGYYGPGDFFGERDILQDDVRSQTLRVTSQAALLYLSQDDFLRLIEAYPRVRDVVEAIADDRERRQMARFHGKRPDEAVIVFTHHHWIGLAGPWSIASAIFAALGLLGLAFPALVPWWALAVLVVLYGIALLYFFSDWRGDWFIVTSKRVIQREASFYIFNESQEEAPLETVQNVSTRINSFLENLLNYGDVVIQTAGSKVEFDRVPHPALTREAILAEVQRVREHRHADELSEIRKALQQRINEGSQPPAALKPPPMPVMPPSFSTRVRRMFGRIQIIPPTRLEKDGQIIWRKHVLVLYRGITLPLLGLLILVPLSIYMVFGDFLGFRMPLLLSLLFATAGTPILLVILFYRYRDWENDIYVLTPEQLIDSERKPFWLEEKVKVIGLGQIQNVRFNRENVLHNLFDFGTVVVQTAGQDTGLVFNDIPGPRDVEENILEALEKFKDRQRERERTQRRREFLDWFGEYHRLQQSEKEQPPANP